MCIVYSCHFVRYLKLKKNNIKWKYNVNILPFYGFQHLGNVKIKYYLLISSKHIIFKVNFKLFVKSWNFSFWLRKVNENILLVNFSKCYNTFRNPKMENTYHCKYIFWNNVNIFSKLCNIKFSLGRYIILQFNFVSFYLCFSLFWQKRMNLKSCKS